MDRRGTAVVGESGSPLPGNYPPHYRPVFGLDYAVPGEPGPHERTPGDHVRYRTPLETELSLLAAKEHARQRFRKFRSKWCLIHSGVILASAWIYWWLN